MDRYYFLNAILFRILLPTFITTCVIFRPSGISAIYLIILFYLPFVPIPDEKTMLGHTGIFLKILIVISVLTTLVQATFQIVLFALPPYAQFLKDDPFLEKILRHVGLVRLNNISVRNVVLWLSPEILMLAISIAFFVSLKKLTVPQPIERSNEEGEDSSKTTSAKPRKKNNYMVAIGRFLVLLALCLAGILRPSVVGSLYFIIFLSAATYWASYHQLQKGFAVLMYCLSPIVFLHLSCFYAYQFEWPQELLSADNLYARLFGLTPLILVPPLDKKDITYDPTSSPNTTMEVLSLVLDNATSITNGTDIKDNDPRNFTFADAEWASFVNPIILYILFYLLVLEAKELLNSQDHFNKSDHEPGEKTPLIRGVSPSKRHGSGKRSTYQSSLGSASATGDNTEDIPLDELGTIEDEYELSVFENILFALDSIVQLIVRSSYIATNIIMMAWSITYLSWLTFVLLIWANLIWLVPNQRKSMLRSSPFLVIYAWFLLISAYIYSMNLKDTELPHEIKGFNLAEIGFVKMENLPCVPLIVKCAYTIMFWITLRQYMQERMEKKKSSALADMVAPLQVTVGTAAGVNRDQEKKGTKIMERIGQHLKKFLTKFWIWVVAVTLFVVAITGERMTGFRILYMALFLIFIISFQFSFQIWRKIMFGFWLTVIIYSMIILILVYTYQFENFTYYWTKYLHIPEEQQRDIGLEKFKVKKLFVRLVQPTFFVIITVIQLHYFHNDFMSLSDPKNTNPGNNDVTEDMEQSSMQGGAYIDRSLKEDPSSPIQFDLYDLENYTSDQFQQLVKQWLERLHRIKNLTYLFLELHMIKVVLLFAMLTCIYDKCALYFLIVIIISLAITFGRPMQLFAIYLSSLLVSILLLARMIYQIQYITPDNWNVNCTVLEKNTTKMSTENIAPWLGFQKMDDVDRSLISLVKWNIVYICIVTFWAVILVRQQNYRITRGRPTTRAFFMFPNITRADADKDLVNCLKYLANYGFYKFGVELSLIMTVAVIGTRMDMYSVFYSIWLCALVSMNRSLLSKVWVFYLIFIAVALPFQYFMAVGLPPTLCQGFPWDKDNQIMKSLQDWAFLLDNYNPPPVKKLILDFLLLLLVSRQWVVFRIERRYTGNNYAGGSNESIIHHAEEKDFKNPVPDFITYVRSYLDIFKRGILQSFLWITLAIVFLAGTNRINIFSIGYLLGAFVFLWHGSDFYLRPIPAILKQWQVLIGYNVAVIFIKASFQILGCIFIQQIPTNCCWLVQLLGIGCVNKYTAAAINTFTPAPGDEPEYCTVPREFIGIAWDGLCFGLLILQKRIFNSYNFFHIVDESKATTILASRGAELIEEMREKMMNYQDEQEHRILEKIKSKMDRIKATQQKMQDSIIKGRRKYRVKPPVTNKQAIRSGDYYMFDELDDEDIDLLPEDIDDKDEKKSLKPDIDEIDENEPKSVRIQEIPEHDDDPQPGTSKYEEMSELTESKDTIGRKLLRGFLFLWAFVESAMISLTNFLNKHSRDYRYVLKVLAKEKKILKEKTAYTVGLRLGPSQVWHPSGSYHSLLRQSMKTASSPVPLHHEVEEMSSYDQPTIVRLLLAIWYIIMSQSEILCYFVIFLNQMKTATFLSLPLPLMVFFWGSLTIPRPSKTFWITIIAYTEVIVLLKCMFQFDIMPGNKSGYETPTFSVSKLIGLYRQDNYAMWDLLLLLVVFFHRVLLKSLGIWTTSPPATAAVLSDGDYKLEDGQLIPVCSSSPKSDTQQEITSSTKSRKDSLSTHSRTTSEENLLSVEVTRNVKIRKYTLALQASFSKYGEQLKLFLQQLLDPTSRVAADVYFLMFLCDFVNFFVILFGYSAFGAQQDGGVSSYIEDNRVPALFLFMLILQFMLLVIDRGIYLRKNILAKIIFQFLQIILLHIWLFVLFPVITGSQCNTVLPPQIYYMVKCTYLLLSAFQIRCGYPTRILGNFLCKGYGYVNMFLFRGFMLIPFLFELRTCMDWMWTETSMTVFDWIKMEDIFAHIFLLKCQRHAEDEFPQPRGEKKKPVPKYILGGGILVAIIGIIWFPLVFFSLGNAVGDANIPYDVTLEIRIGPYEPIYKMSAQSNSIFQFEEDDLNILKNVYNEYKTAETFIYNYEPGDIAAVKLSTDSGSIWSISPPDRERMLEEINSTQPLQVQLSYKVSHRTSKPEDSGIISKEIPITIQPNTKERIDLLNMLNKESANPVLFQYILPKFLKVTNKGTAEPIADLMFPTMEDGDTKLRNITIDLKRTEEYEWWRIKEECNDLNYDRILKQLPRQDCANSIILYTFNDKIFPATLQFISGGGIIGLYTTLVFVASRVLRGFFSDQCGKIMFEDLPNVDRVLQLCLDIYLVREANEFSLEEDLFAKLVFLFRSPETLIKWSRPKEELADDDDPEGDQ